jgi:hypothetical protein
MRVVVLPSAFTSIKSLKAIQDRDHEISTQDLAQLR